MIAWIVSLFFLTSTCQIVVTDTKGNEWIAGEGETCQDAWDHAEFPYQMEWREITQHLIYK